MRLERYSTSGNRAAFIANFCTLQDRVRRDPYRRALLPPAVCERLVQLPLPPVKDFWLVYKSATPIARIAANLSAMHGDVGFFGLLESRIDDDFEDACSLLLSEALAWLAGQGAAKVIGPVTYNTWFPYRLRLDDDERQFDWEPVNPPEYVRAVEAAGFAIHDHYASTAFSGLEHVAELLKPSLDKATTAGFTFPLVGPEGLEASIPDLYRMSHAAFTDNFLFEPIPEALFAEAYIRIADKGQPIILHLAVDPAGTPVGFMYSFIDTWSDGQKTETAIVLKSLCVVPEARGHGIANALVHLHVAEGAKRKVDYAISALVRGGIASEVFARKGEFVWRHDYGVWRHASSTPGVDD